MSIADGVGEVLKLTFSALYFPHFGRGEMRLEICIKPYTRLIRCSMY